MRNVDLNNIVNGVNDVISGEISFAGNLFVNGTVFPGGLISGINFTDVCSFSFDDRMEGRHLIVNG